jgi:mannitol-1-/sugar-/sorbitol-6-phosphatase
MPVFQSSAILFDLDGVLVDSTRAVDREWRTWARSKGVDGDAVMAIAHGVRTVEVIRRVAPHLDAEAEAREIENDEAHDPDVIAMPGASDLVRSIPKGKWGVVTSGSRLLASARLQFCGLPVPEILVTSDDVTNGKPHPEPYLKGAAALGLHPAGCLVIEDAPAGIQSAHAAGMEVIGMASTYSALQLGEANAVIRSFRELSVQLANDRLIVSAGLNSNHKPAVTLRKASASDRAAMVALINSAFAIEKFIEGQRTDEEQLRQMMQQGEFLLGLDSAGQVVASVYVEVRGARGYFGMLSVDPKMQGNGLGKKMVDAAEQYCRDRGCGAMDLYVLSLRPELAPIYRKLGYRENGVEEFRPSRPLKTGAECHCIVMSKEL